MANFNVMTKAGRDKLTPRAEPYFVRLEPGVFVGCRKLPDGAVAWIARKRLESGKQKYHALGAMPDFAAAKAAAEAWARGAERLTVSGPVTVERACRYYVDALREKHREAAARDAEKRFERLIYNVPLGKLSLTKLTPAMLETWLAAQVPPGTKDEIERRQDTANRNWKALRAALNKAFKGGLVASADGWRNVEAFPESDRRRAALADPELIAALLAALPTYLRPFVLGLAWIGCRPGELAAVTAGDFDAKAGTLRLESGKTGERVIGLNAEALELMKAETEDKLPGAYVFTRKFGQPWKDAKWRDPFRLAARAAGLPDGITAYCLRHGELTRLLAGGVDAIHVAKQSGTSVKQLERHYNHTDIETVRNMINSVPTLVKAS
ncbi:integrase [Paraburkholderia youngii]|uniref:tyrosine-type recombinase/integrase n=1 Tax=Paraburkholderia youngii TaxID=2782701 RepID=UPI003D1E3B8E